VNAWYGELPSGWQVTRLKNVVERTQTGVWGDEPRGDSDDILCVRVADFDRPQFAVGSVDTVRSVSAKDREPRLLRPGDLLLEKSGGTDVNPVGFSVMFSGDYPAVASNFIARMRLTSPHSPRFWLYVLAASYSTKRTERSVKRTTGIQNLDLGSYLDESFPVPPADEQRTIAEYLDRETARIDTLIEEQQRLVQMLRERRVAISDHHFSTRENKRETTLRRVVRVLDRPAVPGLGVVTAYRDGTVTLRSNRRDDGYTLSDTEHGYQEVRVGDLVFHALDGFAGAIGISDSNGNATPVYHVCEVVGDDDPNYLALLLRYLGVNGYLATQAPNVRERSVDFRNSATFTRIPVTLPSAHIQRQVVAEIREQTAKIDILIAETERFIELSRERRSALIIAAVTGQNDLRGEAA
jgi:type I restriction enzyme S subunit